MTSSRRNLINVDSMKISIQRRWRKSHVKILALKLDQEVLPILFSKELITRFDKQQNLEFTS